MTQEQLNLMIKIFNLLCTINTHGEDTLAMADSLRAFKEILENIHVDDKGDE